jgi:hypothetical protein
LCQSQGAGAFGADQKEGQAGSLAGSQAESLAGSQAESLAGGQAGNQPGDSAGAYAYGSRGENLVITLDLTGLPLGTRLRSQDALIELTGANSPLFTARVLLPGIVTEGDPIIIE